MKKEREEEVMKIEAEEEIFFHPLSRTLACEQTYKISSIFSHMHSCTREQMEEISCPLMHTLAVSSIHSCMHSHMHMRKREKKDRVVRRKTMGNNPPLSLSRCSCSNIKGREKRERVEEQKRGRGTRRWMWC